MDGTAQAIPDRFLSKATCDHYGVTITKNRDGSVKEHFYPHHKQTTNELVASKRRICADKEFSWSGDREGIGLFGQKACKGYGKYITITEGELDAMSVYEMFDRKWDAVSLVDGSGSAERDVKRTLEFLEGYENIVLCFDSDKEGQKAVNAVKDLFSPNKVRIVQLPLKDANEMLVQGKKKEFLAAWWDAKPYRPDGIVTVEDTWERLLEFRDTPSVPYPWSGLNDMLLGQRTQEIVVWGAPTGIGKTTIMREVQDNLVRQIPDDERVGCLMLEESIAKTTLGWMSFKANRPLHKELATLSNEELRRYWEEASHGNKYVLLDHQGWQNSIDTLKARIRYMRRAMGCRWIILDHLHIALSSVQGASGDWSGIDELMTDLRGIVHELDIGLHLVSHVSGDMQFRGSKGIGQLADAAIFLDRDKHAEGDAANITKVIVDKNRFAGDMGTACYLRYDKMTGRMQETEAPDAPPPPDEF